MKNLFIAPLLALMLLTSTGYGEELQTFTSADGSKTIMAKVLAFYPGKDIVSLSLQNGRQINASLSAFSEADRTVIRSFGRAMNAVKLLTVRFADQEETISEKKNPANGYQTLKLKSGYGVEFRNNNGFDLKGLKVSYQIFYKAYVDPFRSRERTAIVRGGGFDVAQIAAGGQASGTTDSVELTRIRQLPLNECKGGT